MQEFWLENLRRYQTLDQLRKSVFFAGCGVHLERYLSTPQVFSSPHAAPRLQSFLRVAQWNIEKGKRFQPILELLQTDPVLSWADVILLNEADRGMNRSQNRNVARDLARALEMSMVFGPAHFELTKGTDEELHLEGENRESLQGNAVLSRYPVLETRIVPLPVSFEPYEFHEKRFGRRNCLWARLQLKGGSLWVGSVHLELRNTQRCRARQMEHILKNLPGGGKEPCLLGGDLNTNSFARGTTWRTWHSISRLLLCPPARMKRRLFHPELGSEPLFSILKSSGFEWEGLNSYQETARAPLDSLEESRLLPASVLNVMRRRLEPYHGYLCFKLDWLLGKNIRALGSGEVRDADTSIASVGPGCVQVENSGPERISDHLPIYADIDLAYPDISSQRRTCRMEREQK